MNKEVVISVAHLVKSYKKKTVLDNLSFDVFDSEIFGFIGPDGAGKTTLFRIINSLIRQDQGKCTLLGFDNIKDFREIRRRLGYMPGRFSLYYDLSVEENLRFFSSIFNTTIKENYYLIEDIYTHLEPFKDRKAGKLSGGMKQKLALCCSLIHKPDILILDEPTTGVDAVSRKEFWEMLKKIRKQNITILVSTPYMDEASQCSRIALISEGKIMCIDSPEKIVEQFDGKLFNIMFNSDLNLLNKLREYEHCDSVFQFGDSLHYKDRRTNIDKYEIISYLKQSGFDANISEIQPNIEDTFMSLMVKK